MINLNGNALAFDYISNTIRESPTLPPNDVDAGSCLDVTAFTGPNIHPIAI
jgi:hypothetical protein